MTKKVERMLRVAADMQKFGAQNDKLEKLTQTYETELSESELDFVAAAGSVPSFQEFLQRNQK